jgi:hypothetical protein
MSSAYNAYAYPFPVFQPSMRLITAITNANPAQVTTSFPHQYFTGTIVRLDIPIADGMRQANQLFADIVVNSPTTFFINIDTTLFEPFLIPMTTNPRINTAAQVVPIGEINSVLIAAVQNVLPY